MKTYLYSINADGSTTPLNGGRKLRKKYKKDANSNYLRVQIKGEQARTKVLKYLPRGYESLKAAPVAKNEPKKVTQKVQLTKLNDLKFSDDLFKPMPTCSSFDKFVSNEGGIMPGSNIMAAGAPGVGKTTVLLELLHMVRACDPSRKVLFISAEMTELDMARYLKRFPHWGDLPIFFLSSFEGSDPKSALEQVLNEGYDLVLTDSYTEVNDTVKEECGLTRTKTEKWFLDLMNSHNKGNNKLSKYTAFITILQLSKGGQFVGSNKLKHMTSAMMSIDWKGGENSTERFLEFSKNRLGQVGTKLYFSLADGVGFDSNRYQRDLLNKEFLEEEKAKLGTEADAFDKIFSQLPTESEKVGAEKVMPEA